MKSTEIFSGTMAVMVLLTAMIVFCVFGTVLCPDRRLNKREELSCRALEQEYERQLRALLEEKGYSNSGVMMNSITQVDGDRSYVVTIHHKKIEALDNEEKSALAAECREIEVPIRNCSVYFREY